MFSFFENGVSLQFAGWSQSLSSNASPKLQALEWLGLPSKPLPHTAVSRLPVPFAQHISVREILQRLCHREEEVSDHGLRVAVHIGGNDRCWELLRSSAGPCQGAETVLVDNHSDLGPRAIVFVMSR